MRVAVVGATGRIGRLTVAALERRGHETVGISRAAVVDASSSAATDHDEAVAFFSRSTRNLLEAERQTGVEHHVLLTIVGLARFTGNAHAAGKRAPTWSGIFGLDMAGDVLLPGPGARIAPTSFDDWLAGETRS